MVKRIDLIMNLFKRFETFEDRGYIRGKKYKLIDILISAIRDYWNIECELD